MWFLKSCDIILSFCVQILTNVRRERTTATRLGRRAPTPSAATPAPANPGSLATEWRAQVYVLPSGGGDGDGDDDDDDDDDDDGDGDDDDDDDDDAFVDNCDEVVNFIMF